MAMNYDYILTVLTVLNLNCINCSFKWKDEKTASEFLFFLKGIFNAALYCHSTPMFLTAPSS